MTAVSFVADQPAARVHESLRRSLAALEEAQQCAVLWFGEVMRRRLYAELGYSSINRYARQELGFSKSRTWDFVRLARRLDELPAVREAVASGELGYTKAREVVAVATPATEERWLEAAKRPRRELVREVKRAKRAARVDPGQGELLPSRSVVSPRELPVRFQLDLTPEQEARRAALVEKLHKLGGAPTDRAELLLEALAALVESQERSPRGDLTPPVQVHVHQCPECAKIEAEGRALGRADRERLDCDAAVCESGGRNRSIIPPRVRRQVLARDRHRCRAPGCDRTRFLEVHHVVPRRQGGTNDPANLVTLCAACHRLWHERGVTTPPAAQPQPAG